MSFKMYRQPSKNETWAKKHSSLFFNQILETLSSSLSSDGIKSEQSQKTHYFLKITLKRLTNTFILVHSPYRQLQLFINSLIFCSHLVMFRVEKWLDPFPAVIRLEAHPGQAAIPSQGHKETNNYACSYLQCIFGQFRVTNQSMMNAFGL